MGDGLSHGIPMMPSIGAGGRRYVQLIAGFIAASVCNFLGVVVFSRWLGPAGYGQLAVFLAVGQTAVYFATFWATSPLLRFGAEEFQETGSFREVFWGRALVLLPCCLCAGWLLWLSRAAWARLTNLEHLNAWWMAGYVGAIALTQSVRLSYQTAGRTAVSAGWQALEPAMWLVGVAVAIWTGAVAHPRVVIHAIVVGSAVVGLASLATLPASWWWPPVVRHEQVRRLLVFSWPLAIGQVGGYLMTQWVAVALLRHWRSLEAVGLFQVAHQLMGALQQLVLLTVPVTLPLLAGVHGTQRDAAIHRYLHGTLPKALALFVLTLAGCFLVAHWVVPWWFGAAYREAVILFGVLLVGLGASGVFVGLTPVLHVEQRNDLVMGGMLVGGLTTLVLDVWLIPRAGTLGAASASAAGFVACAGVTVGAMVYRPVSANSAV